jgi:hypothetical protein
MAEKKILSRLEQVSFPEFAGQLTLAKIDTGAYTGALHCNEIIERDEEGGKALLFLPLESTELVHCEEYAVRHVRSSNGVRDQRYFIETEIVVQGQTYPITLSLTDRKDMKYPVLIGRRFLRKNHFLVDVLKPTVYVEQQDGTK